MKKAVFTILLGIGFLISNIGLAEEIKTRSRETKSRCLEGVEFFTGFGWGKLRAKENYHLYPVIVDFDLNLKVLTQKFNFNPAQLLQFQIEPFISTVSQPDANVEIGTSFFFKFGLLPQSSKFQPYGKIGVGMVYMTQHTREQGTQFNFIDTAALGMHYFFRKNTAFTLEGRFRHLSNAGTDNPNSGINTYFVVVGLSYRF